MECAAYFYSQPLPLSYRELTVHSTSTPPYIIPTSLSMALPKRIIVFIPITTLIPSTARSITIAHNLNLVSHTTIFTWLLPLHSTSMPSTALTLLTPLHSSATSGVIKVVEQLMFTRVHATLPTTTMSIEGNDSKYTSILLTGWLPVQ